MMQIIYSDMALKDSDKRKFPTSRHRSKRVHKKLLKRFGGEFVKVPCMYRVHGNIIAHPALKADIERATARNNNAYATGNPWG
jgi:hypothetical protein